MPRIFVAHASNMTKHVQHTSVNHVKINTYPRTSTNIYDMHEKSLAPQPNGVLDLPGQLGTDNPDIITGWHQLGSINRESSSGRHKPGIMNEL